jgi:hypothetical protein
VTRAQFTAILTPVLVALTFLPALGQSSPTLTRQQRAALQAVVAAVSRAEVDSTASSAQWAVHTLRASDGSHYVAFSVMDPPGLVANQPVVLYVRLATRRGADTLTAERSAVAEWLAGQRTTPRKERGFAFGDMPTFGAGAIAARGPGPQNLTLLELERERARERREAAERDRKATLEGAAGPRGPHPLLPFEDFDVRAIVSIDRTGSPVLRRSLTTGPGDYNLLVGWVDPAAKDLPSAVRVVKHPFQLTAASTTEFSLSDVILADEVGVRETPFAAGEQSAHPYAIGTIDIAPARDHELTPDERLSLVVQVINPRAAADGKPDVAVGFRLFRTTPSGQEPLGTLSPQVYNRTTLPPDFDATKGHPIFAAVAVPLRTFRRGAYRLQVLADDRLAGVSTTSDARFTVTSTPVALLADAPPLVQPFRREAVLDASIVTPLVAQLRPSVPSTALAAALLAAQERRFIELVREDAVSAQEAGSRALLRALALYAIGDAPAGVNAALRHAQQLSAPAGPAAVLAGAVRALEGNDRDAIDAWQTALTAGFDSVVLRTLLADALLRLADGPGAAAVATAGLSAYPGNSSLGRRVALAHLVRLETAPAIAVLDTIVAAHPDDRDAHWLLLHAHYLGMARRNGPGSDAAGQARIKELAARYQAMGGAHAALAAEWAASVK